MGSRRMRVLLVDDEPLANAGLRTLLVTHSDVEIVGEASGGSEAIRAIHDLRPDLVFLDVQMPQVDGFAVLRAVGAEAMPAVIFVTAYDEFAVRAFEVSALDYLVKPVAADRFHQALERARRALAQARDGTLVERVRSLLEMQPAQAPSTGYASRLFVRIGARDVLLPVADIDWIEADDYCAIVHARGARHVIRETLGALAKRLDPDTFERIHRSAIVNVSRVRELRRQGLGGLRVVLADGTTIPVSRNRRAAFTARLGRAR
jgi:two-component system, LytTR family, response regulator